MEQQVPYLNKRLLAFLVLLISCRPQEQDLEKPILNSNDQDLLRANGVVYYKQEPFSGRLFSLSENGKDTLAKFEFLEGFEHGIWEKYYPGDRLQERREYAKGKKVGQFIAFWENGQKKLDYHFLNDEYEGFCREWNQSGVLVKAMNYQNGYEVGKQTMYFDNGKIRSNYLMKNGRRYGLLGTKNCVNVSAKIK